MMKTIMKMMNTIMMMITPKMLLKIQQFQTTFNFHWSHRGKHQKLQQLQPLQLPPLQQLLLKKPQKQQGEVHLVENPIVLEDTRGMIAQKILKNKDLDRMKLLQPPQKLPRQRT